MGWKLAKKYRDSMLAKSMAIVDRGPCDIAIGDGTALMYLASSGKFVQTAVQVAGRMFKLLYTKSQANFVMLCFDGPASQMPPRRGQLYASRYKPKTESQLAIDAEKGKLIIAGKSYTPGTEPYSAEELETFTFESKISWTRLLASREGKITATKLLIRGLKFDARANPRCSSFRLIISGGPDEIAFFYPRAPHLFDPSVIDQIEAIRWGEADNRVAQSVQILSARHSKSIRVFTIDTDMMLQLICVKLGSSATDITLDLIKSDLIDVIKLRQSTGGTMQERLSSVALLLCAKGCDYSNGMTIFGYRQEPFVDAAFLNSIPFVNQTENGGLSFDVEIFSKIVKHVPRWSIKTTTCDQVRDELTGMLTTLGLFSLVGAQNSPPGPRDVNLGDFTTGASSDPFAAICLEGLAAKGMPIMVE